MTFAATEDPQTAPLHGPNLILDVENFGPIAEAKNIEFKPMTVFVGPSNTGKTYFAVLLHAFLQANPTLSDSGFGFSRLFSNNIFREPHLLQDFLADYLAVKKRRRTAEKTSNLVAYSALNESSQRFLDSFIDPKMDSIWKSATKNVKEYFEIDDISAMSSNTLLGKPRVVFALKSENVGLTIQLDDEPPILDLSSYPVYIDTDIAKLGELQLRSRDDGADDSTLSFPIELMLNLNQVIAHSLPSAPDSHYFPTGRSGIMNGHRVFTSQIISNAHLHGIEDRGSTTYHRIAREFLRDLVNLRQNPIRSGSDDDQSAPGTEDHAAVNRVANVLEETVMDGNVQISETIGSPDFRFVTHDNSMPMFRASSAVTELAPVVMFLRNYVNTGDLLIIDEPEAHLHPEAQQRMAAALAFMVRSGLRVLITTHSHYMVEQLSAFVNASKLDEITRKRALSLGGVLGEEDIYLNEQEAAVYGFDQSNVDGGTVVYEIPLGEHREYSPRDHSKAVNRQYNRLQRVLEARERLGV